MRATGYKRDEADARDWTIYKMPKIGTTTVGDLPKDVNLCGYAAHVFDQGQAGSCVEWALSRLIHVNNHGEGPFPSVQAWYALARAAELGTTDQPLEDIGSYPRVAASILTSVGWCPEERFPYDVGTINDRPDWGCLRAMSDQRTSVYYRIDVDADADALRGTKVRCDDVCRALMHGHGVAIGVPVGMAFENYQTGILQPTAADDVEGLHMLAILGYTFNADGSRTFRGVNSWGTSWGQAGFFEVSESFIQDTRVTDLYVIGEAP